MQKKGFTNTGEVKIKEKVDINVIVEQAMEKKRSSQLK